MEQLKNHSKIALQFSGGRDSLACLFYMRDYLDKIEVYFLDSGDIFPETRELISYVSNNIKHVHIVQGRSKETRAQFGMPSDIVPTSLAGIDESGYKSNGQIKIQDRYSCCYNSIMAPMHQRMIDDGITLIIRGQKNSDEVKSLVRSGDVYDGVEVFFPIEKWTDIDVMNYLQSVGAPIPRFYEMIDLTPDCMGCTAWWDKQELKYLKRYHHDQYKENLSNLEKIRAAVEFHIVEFNRNLFS